MHCKTLGPSALCILVAFAGAMALAGCETKTTPTPAPTPTPTVTRFTASLNSTQEAPTPPSPNTAAAGVGAAQLSADRTQVKFTVSVSGLSGAIAASHFHQGAVGVAGGIVKNITFSGNTAAGTWSTTDASQPLTTDLITALLAGNLYFNVHTATNPGGEIRGQIATVTGTPFTASLNSAQEVPTPPSPNAAASGVGSVILSADLKSATFSVTVNGLSGAIAASHFHQGAVGVAGGIVKNITFSGNTATGTWSTTDASQPLTTDLVNALVTGNLYFNVHTAANPGGEIRGQITTL